jgi:hypothetical protein
MADLVIAVLAVGFSFLVDPFLTAFFADFGAAMNASFEMRYFQSDRLAVVDTLEKFNPLYIGVGAAVNGFMLRKERFQVFLSSRG